MYPRIDIYDFYMFMHENDLQCYMHSVAVLKITRIPGRQFYLNPASEAHSWFACILKTTKKSRDIRFGSWLDYAQRQYDSDPHSM